jgi:transcriptional regulator with PAS, ATPase and Fis domain
MDESLLKGIIDTFQVAVFTREGSYWTPLGTLPTWTRELSIERSPSSAGVAFEKSAFLSFFISECEAHWNSKSKDIKRSDLFSDQSLSDGEDSFEAMATTLEEQTILMIQRQDPTQQDLNSVYQKGRDGELAQEALERVQQELIVSKQQVEHLLVQLKVKHETVLSLLSELEIGALVVTDSGEIDFVSALAIEFLDLPASLPTHIKEVTVGKLNLVWHELLEGSIRKKEIELQGSHNVQRYLEVELKPYPQHDSKYILFLHDVTKLRLLQNRIKHEFQFSSFATQNTAMQRVHKVIQDVAATNWTVLIQGETGTGKEVTARSVHNASPRSHMPFLAVNCAGLSDTLLQSELFGHKKGSFTGAFHDHVGLFEAANGGTLFLDEIGDITPNMQQSLLRVLEERTVKRVGDVQERPIDVRIVVATHKDLEEEIRIGNFRSDLFFRLRVGRVQLPPLRERKEDIEKLAYYFLRESASAVNKDIYGVTKEAMQALQEYNWPGNVRELRSAIEYTVMHIQGSRVEIEDLPPEVIQKKARNELPSTEVDGIPPSVLEDTKEGLLTALEKHRGNRSKAAKVLGLSRATFYRRLREYGLE